MPTWIVTLVDDEDHDTEIILTAPNQFVARDLAEERHPKLICSCVEPYTYNRAMREDYGPDTD